MKITIPETKKLKEQLIEANLAFRKLKDEYQEKSLAAKTKIQKIRDLISSEEQKFIADISNQVENSMAIYGIARKYNVSPSAVANWRRMHRESEL